MNQMMPAPGAMPAGAAGRLFAPAGRIHVRDGCAGRIAIIDDDAAVLDSLRFLLEVSGHRVATFGSATEFLQSDGVAAPCLIVDQHMPNMTGLELIARLAATPGERTIMLITGSASAAIRERAAALGVAKVLEKPPAENELLDFVNACNGA